MKHQSISNALTRRDFVRASAALAASALTGGLSSVAQAADAPASPSTKPYTSRPAKSAHPHPLLTPAGEFRDVSRGTPKPYTLQGDALVQARLTPETWRLEITTDETPNPAIKETASLSKPLTLADGSALDLPALLELGKKHEVKFLKAMQCLNMPTPLGQSGRVYVGAPQDA